MDPNWKPTHCVWELTLQCNMRCLHCGSYAGAAREDELSPERALELVDEMVELGLKRITLSGGEPLLRKDWHVIADRLMKKGVKTGIISNGWFIEENIETFARLDWDVVAMSLDGLRRTHDAFRRTPGSYNKILSAFRALNKKGIETACITCVSQYNFHEMDAIHDVLLSHGVSAWQVQPLFVGGRTREYRDSMMLDIPHLYEIAKFIARKKKVSPINIFPADGVGYYSRFEDVIRPEGWSGCQAGLKVMGVEANGNIKGCLSLYPECQSGNPFVEGNIQEKSLREIWENPDGFAYNRQFDPTKAEGFCAECEHLRECRCGCSSEAFFSTGTTYNNPYCMHSYVVQHGEPLQKTTVPMAEGFEDKMNECHSQWDEKKGRKRTGLKKNSRNRLMMGRLFSS